MSAIYINGEPIVQSNFPEMTLAQYNALPEAERPEFWIRTDASYNSIPGTAVTFNNTGTDIESTDVDGAIKEVDAKTQHGLYEAWKNADINSNFAGQTINLTNFDSNKIDAVIIAFEESKDEAYGTQWREFDKDVLNSPSTLRRLSFLNVSNTAMAFYTRTVTFALNETTLSIGFSDATIYMYPFSGTGQTSTTNNGVLIPVRILVMVHND